MTKKIIKLTSKVLIGVLAISSLTNFADDIKANNEISIKELIPNNENISIDFSEKNEKVLLVTIKAKKKIENLILKFNVSGKQNYTYKNKKLESGEEVKFEVNLENIASKKKVLPNTDAVRKSEDIVKVLKNNIIKGNISYDVEEITNKEKETSIIFDKNNNAENTEKIPNLPKEKESIPALKLSPAIKKEFKVELVGSDLKLVNETNIIKANEEVTVLLEPKEKYHPVSFLVNGEEKLSDLVENKIGEHHYNFKYKFNIKEDTEIRVQYEKFCELTLKGEGLSSVPNNSIRLKPNSEVTVNITPPKDKTLNSFVVENKNFKKDLVGQVKNNEYTFIMDTCTTITADYKDIVENPESDFTFDERTGTILDYSYFGAKDIIIPETIKGVPVRHIGEYAFYSKGINSVKLPKSLLTIGEQAFMDNGLTNVEIPDKVKRIETGAFANNKIKNLILPTEIEYFGAGVFMGNKLENFVIPSNMTIIPRRFLENNELKTIMLPDSVVRINEKAFMNNNLTIIYIPKSVEFIANLAFSKNKIKNVEFKNPNIKLYPNAFDYGVKSNIEDDGKVILVEEKDLEFDKTTGTITKYNGTDWNIEIPKEISGVKVIKIGFTEDYDGKVGAFQNKNLNKVIIPEGITTIDENSFKNNSITELTLPSTITNINKSAFENNNISKIELPKKLSVLEENVFRNNHLTTVNLSNVTEIKAGAFANNKIKQIELPNNLTTIEREVFQNNSLESITLPKNITTIKSNAFSSNKITELNIPEKLEIIEEGAFSGNQLSSLELPKNVREVGRHAFAYNILKKLSVKGNTEILNKAFYTNKIVELDLSDGVVLKEGEIFQFNGLKNVKIPKATKRIPHLVFAANQITNIEFHNEVTEIGYGSFYVNKLEELILPDNILTIGNAAFFNNNIKKLKLPNNLTIIDAGSFRMNKLTEVVIPNSVNIIKEGAFKENKIKNVTIKNSVENQNGFDDNVNIILNN